MVNTHHEKTIKYVFKLNGYSTKFEPKFLSDIMILEREMKNFMLQENVKSSVYFESEKEAKNFLKNYPESQFFYKVNKNKKFHPCFQVFVEM